MKHFLKTASAAAVLLASFSASAADIKPSVVFDMGGKFDKSFNQAAFDGVRAIAERQADMVRESVEATAGAVEAMRTVKEPKDAMEKQADFARTAFDKVVKDTNELRDMAVKTGTDVTAPISAHIRSSMDEAAAMANTAAK